MDMVQIRRDVASMQPLTGAPKLKKVDGVGVIVPDIFVKPTNAYTIKRLVPIPLWGPDGNIDQDRNGNYLFTMRYFDITVAAFSLKDAVRRLNAPFDLGGVIENLIHGRWQKVDLSSRPWSGKAPFKMIPSPHIDNVINFDTTDWRVTDA